MGELDSSRWGKIIFQEKDIIRFPKGIIGFSNFENYLLLKKKEDQPFKWLQSIDDPNLAFVLIDPLVFFPNYNIKPNPEELVEIKESRLERLKIYVIVTLYPHPGLATANLIAPLLFNFEEKLGKQIVLSKSPYTARHFLSEGAVSKNG
jgi:flagellar assembly factor FliW